MHRSDICIAGGGIIGLSLALELHRRGLSVTVLDRGQPLSEASTAAAGMLAASDPENPAPLRRLADLSLSLYPAFLERLQELSGVRVPFHTGKTLQSDLSASPDTALSRSAHAYSSAALSRRPALHLYRRAQPRSPQPCGSAFCRSSGHDHQPARQYGGTLRAIRQRRR